MIKLPGDKDGNPDWEFMENYIKSPIEKERDNIEFVEIDYQFDYPINPKLWKSFKLSNLFEILKVNKYSKIPELGNVPFVTSQSINNGICCFVNVKPSCENAITISTNGNNFDCFYHDYKFAVSSDVEVIKNDKLNKYNGIFICTVLKQNQFRYSYGRKAKNNAVSETIIKLPADKDGNPDWEFMENYIKSLREKERKRLQFIEINEQKFYQLDIKKWKKFRIGELFQLEKGKCSSAPDLSEGNDIFYIGAKKTDNGVMNIVKTNKNLVSKGNCICFICQGAGSNGYSNYFSIDTIQSTSNVLGYNEHLTENIGTFIVAVSDLERFKWSFGRGRSPKLANETILLPADNNGNPDWQFMEEYMKSIKIRENNRLYKLFLD